MSDDIERRALQRQGELHLKLWTQVEVTNFARREAALGVANFALDVRNMLTVDSKPLEDVLEEANEFLRSEGGDIDDEVAAVRKLRALLDKKLTKRRAK